MPYSNIDKPSKYFNTVTYTGTGASLSITGVGFQPDWVWIKSRSTAVSNVVFDVLRGVNNRLETDTTAVETFNATALTSFDADGFTVGAGSSRWNNNGLTYASWNWKANGTGVSNTSGTITSTVSANTTSGFSIVQGQMNGSGSWTVGHGLGVTPSMIICRGQNVTSVWATYHKSLGAGNYLSLNATDASTANTNVWNNTSPTSSVYSMNATFWSAGSGQNFIAYCFAEVKGFSKAFSYTGNGSTDGTYIHLGFRPAFVMTKASSTTGNWKISWNTFSNGNDSNLAPNLSGAETSSNQIDLLSNGFKCRASDTDRNGSGTTYIGFAIAENPFVSSKGIPVCAR